jgi:diacylglycerol kinase
MEHKHSILKSFEFALNGLKGIIIQERNFKIQLFAGILAVILGLLLKLNSAEWLDLVIVITLVLILELVNTSIEEMVDLVSPQFQEKAKVAKDVAAATVLVASFGSVVIGAFLFIPKIMNLFR